MECPTLAKGCKNEKQKVELVAELLRHMDAKNENAGRNGC